VDDLETFQNWNVAGFQMKCNMLGMGSSLGCYDMSSRGLHSGRRHTYGIFTLSYCKGLSVNDRP
jgi:hypothetical protein